MDHSEINRLKTELAEAVALLRYAMESSSFREILTLERDISAFLARHAQAEEHVCDKHGEDVCHDMGCPYHNAQGAQAGDERAAFESDPAFVGMNFSRAEAHPEYYESPFVNGAWEGWQARAALATQPAAGEPKPIGYISETVRQELLNGKHVPANICTATPSRRNPHPGPDASWSVPIFAAPPAPPHGDEAVRWVPCSERLPEVAQFDQQEFIVSVQRKDKVITMSALYLNAYPLYCEDHDDADDEGYVPHTGWYDAKSNGDDANCHTLVNDSWYGSTVTHWMPMPKPAAAMRAQGDGGEV